MKLKGYSVTYLSPDEYPGEEYKFPLIIFTFEDSVLKEWILSDIGHKSDLEKWKNIRECIFLDKDSNSFGHDGNSFWQCQNKETIFEIRYSISGSGGDSDIFLAIPNKDILECIDKIIEILECTEINKRYLPSNIE